MTAFSEYPKMLVHPSSQPAQVGFEPMQGRPTTFPPVTVNNADQEENYKARGYVVQGSSDEAAYERAKAGGHPVHYRYEEYPKFIEVDGVPVIATCEAHEHELLKYNPMTESKEKVAERRKPGRPRKEAA